MTSSANEAPSNWAQRHKGLIIGLVVTLILGVVLYAFLSWRNGIANEGFKQQNNIVTLQKNVELEISTCLDKGATAAKVATQEYATLKDLLVNVTAARYEGGNGALSQGGPLISALQENYPQIDQSTWGILLSVVTGCRDDIRDRQERLLGYATNFKNWTATGGLIEKTVRNNFPSEQLTTIDRKTGELLMGGAALEYLTRVITVEDAKKAMESGTMPTQDLFPTSEAVPTTR